MNLLSEIEHLPRSSQITLAIDILRRTRPSIKDMAHHGCVNQSAIYEWLGCVELSYPAVRYTRRRKATHA